MKSSNKIEPHSKDKQLFMYSLVDCIGKYNRFEWILWYRHGEWIFDEVGNKLLPLALQILQDKNGDIDYEYFVNEFKRDILRTLWKLTADFTDLIGRLDNKAFSAM